MTPPATIFCSTGRSKSIAVARNAPSGKSNGLRTRTRPRSVAASSICAVAPIHRAPSSSASRTACAPRNARWMLIARSPNCRTNASSNRCIHCPAGWRPSSFRACRILRRKQTFKLLDTHSICQRLVDDSSKAGGAQGVRSESDVRDHIRDGGRFVGREGFGFRAASQENDAEELPVQHAWKRAPRPECGAESRGVDRSGAFAQFGGERVVVGDDGPRCVTAFDAQPLPAIAQGDDCRIAARAFAQQAARACDERTFVVELIDRGAEQPQRGEKIVAIAKEQALHAMFGGMMKPLCEERA